MTEEEVKIVNDLCFKAQINNSTKSRVVEAAQNYGVNLVSNALKKMCVEAGKVGESKLAYFRRLCNDALMERRREKHQANVLDEINNALEESAEAREHIGEITPEKLQRMVAEALEHGGPDLVPNNVPPEILNDPDWLRAKQLEWGMNGAKLLQEVGIIPKLPKRKVFVLPQKGGAD